MRCGKRKPKIFNKCSCNDGPSVECVKSVDGLGLGLGPGAIFVMEKRNKGKRQDGRKR